MFNVSAQAYKTKKLKFLTAVSEKQNRTVTVEFCSSVFIWHSWS